MTTTVTLDPQWAGRRRVIYVALTACLGLSVYAISKDAATANAVVGPLSILAGMIIGSYVFGASWEAVKGVPSGNIAVTTTTPTQTTTTTTTIETPPPVPPVPPAPPGSMPTMGPPT